METPHLPGYEQPLGMRTISCGKENIGYELSVNCTWHTYIACRRRQHKRCLSFGRWRWRRSRSVVASKSREKEGWLGLVRSGRLLCGLLLVNQVSRGGLLLPSLAFLVAGRVVKVETLWGSAAGQGLAQTWPCGCHRTTHALGAGRTPLLRGACIPAFVLLGTRRHPLLPLHGDSILEAVLLMIHQLDSSAQRIAVGLLIPIFQNGIITDMLFNELYPVDRCLVDGRCHVENPYSRRL
ncbi:hypothetical protein V8F20_004670 [Naviculisporaceae sp. PSN 640]